jgi:hypothetical protein
MIDGDWLAPHRLISIVIGFTLLEGVALWVYRLRTGKGVPGRDFIANWVSGLCLMMALLSAVLGAWWVWVAVWMMASGLAHWSDLWARWQR